MLLVKICAGALVAVALCSCVAERSPDSKDAASSTTDVASPAAESTWRTTTPSPLSPRHGVAAAWTGSEVVLVGGDTQTPCPPNADCAYSARPSADAAAYDPVSDSWRILPDAPVRVAGGVAWWTGDEVIVVADGHTLSLDPATSEWRRLGPSPAVGSSVVPVEDGLVFVSYDQRGRAETVDWVLDTESGRWSALARDPFAESYDRSMAWDGRRLWLLSMAVENHFKAHAGAPSRLAVLRDDEWQVVDASTPPLTYEQRLWWYDDALVVGKGTYGGTGQVYDPDTGAWSELPPAGPDRCGAPAAGPGPTWLSVGAALTTGSTGSTVDTIPLPPCPALTSEGRGPDVAVWASERLFVWGADAEHTRTTGLTWSPPPPS